ncbi:helix-turn-helix domain-containing protein, partial [Streptomyces puniciscabiei]
TRTSPRRKRNPAPRTRFCRHPGHRVPAVADQLRRSRKTVRRRLHRFNRWGPAGLGDLGRQGRTRRIAEAERSGVSRPGRTATTGPAHAAGGRRVGRGG